MKFKTAYNAKPSKGEINDMDSMTIPNDSMSLQQLLINHTRGIGLGVSEIEGTFTGDEEAPIFQDPLEQAEYKKKNQQRKKEVNEEVKKDIENAKQKKEAEKATGNDNADSKTETGNKVPEDKK